jgi:hypothetical protein
MQFSIGLGGRFGGDVEADATARRVGRLRELLDEVAYATLDLFDIAFDNVNAALELCYLPNLVQPI